MNINDTHCFLVNQGHWKHDDEILLTLSDSKA